MKITITKGKFIQSFIDAGRRDQFTWEARGALFDYLTELEEGTGVEMELDPIAVCCDFTECTYAEAVRDHSIDIDPERDVAEQVIEYLQGETPVIYSDSEFVTYANF